MFDILTVSFYLEETSEVFAKNLKSSLFQGNLF